MLALLIVASGCFGSGTTEGDEEVGSTVNNYYWNNTTTTTIAPEPEIFATNVSGDYWRYTSLNINQSAGEAIHILDLRSADDSGAEGGIFVIQTTCGEIYWDESNMGTSPDFSEPTHSFSDMWLTGAGLDCTHRITTRPFDSAGDLRDDTRVWEIQLSMVYHRHAVTIE